MLLTKSAQNFALYAYSVLEPVLKNQKFQSLLLAWFVPAMVPVVVFIMFVVPSASDVALLQEIRSGLRLVDINPALAVTAIVGLAAALAGFGSAYFYNLLSGRSWPSPLRNRLIDRRHRPQAEYLRNLRETLRAQVQLAESSQNSATVDTYERWTEKLANADKSRLARGRETPFFLSDWGRRRPFFTERDHGMKDRFRLGRDSADWVPVYPEDLRYLEPTILGNHIAAAESLGSVKFGLDAGIFLHQIQDVGSEQLVKSLADARSRTDALIALMISSLAGALTTAYVILASSSAPAWLWVLVAGGAIVGGQCHHHLPSAVDQWGDVLAALVTSARPALAQKYSLELPTDPDQEREMWDALAGTIYYGRDSSYRALLAKFSKPAEASTSPKPNR